MKDFILHKLTLRVLYIVAAFVTSRFIAVLSAPGIESFIDSIPAWGSRIGLKIQIDISVADPALLKGAIVGFLLVAGEFIYHFFHNRFILPHVAPKETPAK